MFQTEHAKFQASCTPTPTCNAMKYILISLALATLCLGCVDEPTTQRAWPQITPQPDNAPTFEAVEWQKHPTPKLERQSVRLFEGQTTLMAIGMHQADKALFTLNDDRSWHQHSTLPHDVDNEQLQSLQIIEASNQTLWLADAKQRLWRHHEGIWQRAPQPWPTDHGVYRLWRQGNTIYAVEAPLSRTADAQMTLWKYENQTWTHVHNKGFMIIDYLPLPNVLIHAMHYGWLSISRDGGKQWTPQTDGPQHQGRPALFQHNEHVWAITHRGIWQTDLNVSAWHQVTQNNLSAFAHRQGKLFLYDAGTATLHFGQLHNASIQTTQSVQAVQPIRALHAVQSGVVATHQDGSLHTYTQNQHAPLALPKINIEQHLHQHNGEWLRTSDGQVWHRDQQTWKQVPIGRTWQLVGTDEGIMALGQHTLTWWNQTTTRRLNLPTQNTQRGQLFTHQDTTLFAHQGILWTLDPSGTWQQHTDTLPVDATLAQNARQLFAYSSSQGLLYSEDLGQTWQSLTRTHGECKPTAPPHMATPWLVEHTNCGVAIWRLHEKTLQREHISTKLEGVVEARVHRDTLLIIDNKSRVWRQRKDTPLEPWLLLPKQASSLHISKDNNLTAIGEQALYTLPRWQ